MSETVQSYAVLAIVLITLSIFVWRAVKRRQAGASSCGGGCGCSGTTSKTSASLLKGTK